jgi:DNA-binding MarR family transcriptional regulator
MNDRVVQRVVTYGGTPTERLMLLVLAVHADDWGRTSLSVSELATLMGVHRRTASRTLAGLRVRGLVGVDEQARGEDGRVAKTSVFLVPPGRQNSE